MTDLFIKLDLSEYLNEFKALLAREKELFLEGDSSLHFKRINELCEVQFTPPKSVPNLEQALTHLSKQGILHLDELFHFVKICKYFSYLKKLHFGSSIQTWLEKILIPTSVLEICEYFDEKGKLKSEIDERLQNFELSLRLKKEQISSEFKKLAHSKSLSAYLMDTQIHLIGQSEALLVRGGFNNALKARVIARSSGGGFYIVPVSIERLNDELRSIEDKQEEVLYEYAKKISTLFSKELLFLKFINRSFDIFDHYSARVLLARARDYEFVLNDSSKDIILKDFAHPALKNPKSISVECKKQVLIITGVNAGGKSMLLKSLLSAVLLSKYLLPMKIASNKSKIGSFKQINAIIEDPQNVKNDISTFAGRMLEFSKLLGAKDLLLGVDEIELGTDFEEAACLYSEIISKLIEQNQKIIITTHHKRLAFLLAKNEQVGLLAALYDEQRAKPKYEFMQGLIGKSYAFETALRYGISKNLIAKARQNYGEDKGNLEKLVSDNINLELELKQKLQIQSQKEQKIEQILSELKEQKTKQNEELLSLKNRLERQYYEAIKEAKNTLNFKDLKDRQRSINRANEAHKKITLPSVKTQEEFQVGDFVKYGKLKGKILSVMKNEALIECEGLRLRVGLNLLHKSSATPKMAQKTKINIQKPSALSPSLDLHGLRSDEAIDLLDKYLSDALIAGLDEVLIYHGIGTGKLAYAVKEFLKAHKSVKSFEDAPLNQGGFGAKLVKF